MTCTVFVLYVFYMLGWIINTDYDNNLLTNVINIPLSQQTL